MVYESRGYRSRLVPHPKALLLEHRGIGRPSSVVSGQANMVNQKHASYCSCLELRSLRLSVRGSGKPNYWLSKPCHLYLGEVELFHHERLLKYISHRAKGHDSLQRVSGLRNSRIFGLDKCIPATRIFTAKLVFSIQSTALFSSE